MRLFLARLAITLAVVGIGQLASIAEVGAAAPRHVLGTWATSAPVITAVHPAGINAQLVAVATARFVGDFAGTTVFTGTFILDPQGNMRTYPTEPFPVPPSPSL